MSLYSKVNKLEKIRLDILDEFKLINEIFKDKVLNKRVYKQLQKVLLVDRLDVRIFTNTGLEFFLSDNWEEFDEYVSHDLKGNPIKYKIYDIFPVREDNCRQHIEFGVLGITIYIDYIRENE